METPVFTLTPACPATNDNNRLDSLLRDYLEEKGMKHLRWYGEALKRIEKVVNPILKELKKRDRRLNFELMSPESYFKVVRSNIFEIYIVFKKMSHDHGACLVELLDDSILPGSGLVQIKEPKLQQAWCELLQGSFKQGFFISPMLLFQRINNLLQDICKKNTSLRDRNIWFECSGGTNGILVTISYEGHQYFVHLIPTISMDGIWPKCATMWQKVMFRWPDDGVRRAIVEKGVHVVCKTTATVAKTTSTSSLLSWQISFLNGEKALLQTFKPGCRNKCLQILKTLLESTLSYPEGITPYHVETITLHLNSLISSPSLWLDTCLASRFLDLISALQRSLAHGTCNHFFAPSIQLYTGIPHNTLKILSKRLKSIIDCPEEFFQSLSLGTVTTQF